MKILQVAPRYPPQTGGVETHVRAVGERLVDRGHEVIVRTADATGDGARRERRNGVRVRRHYGIAPGGAFHLAPGIFPAVRRAEVDVVHAHNYHSFPMALAALGVDGTRLVATTHYHGGSASAFRDRLLSLYHPVGRWALGRADAVVAVSEWERRQLSEDFDVDATVVPNGLDVERFRDADPPDRDRPYLLCVGRLEEYKGVQYAIRALTELPDQDLLVAGSGPYREQLERIAAREGVDDRVEFLGYVDADRLPELYAGATLHMALSEFEAYGMTVAEALASGTPCVVRDAAALTDWTGRPGVVGVSDVDPRSVADAVLDARAATPDPNTVPRWDTVTQSLEEIYHA